MSVLILIILTLGACVGVFYWLFSKDTTDSEMQYQRESTAQRSREKTSAELERERRAAEQARLATGRFVGVLLLCFAVIFILFAALCGVH